MACATDLMRVALPYQDIFLLFQPQSLFSNFSFIGLRSLLMLAEKNIGTPRYYVLGGRLLSPQQHLN